MTEQMIKKAIYCRICNSQKLTIVLRFGPTPLANKFLTKDQLDFPEAFYPLDVVFCENCSFLQLGHVVASHILFDKYLYVSSTSPVFVSHFNKFAADIVSRFKLNKKSCVIDIGSNDGILLKPYEKAGIRVLGVEPAKHIAKIARNDRIPTVAEFFSLDLARRIVKTKGKAKIVTATNVFAHIDDLDEVINGVKELLDKDGVFILEAPYLIDFLKKKYFDLVYHEHLSYWALKPLVRLFEQFDMKIFDVQKVSVHGGSIRVFATKEKSSYVIEKRVDEYLQKEKQMKLSSISIYLDFAKEVLRNKAKLTSLLVKLKMDNKRIVGYGSPAKGNTMLNYFKIGSDILDYIIDDSPFKQGLYTPGTHIPVVSASKLKTDRPDYILILAWNFAENIMEKYNWFKDGGGKFILPVPRPLIV